MDLQLAPLGPAVGGVMMIYITQQQTVSSFVYDQPNIPAYRHGPEVWVFSPVELWKLKPGLAGFI